MTATTTGTLELTGGVVMPRLGLGTWPLTGDAAEATVRTAISLGYRRIDTAAAYCNEDAVSRGMAAVGVEREAMFITTKLKNSDHGYDSALRGFDQSMNALGLDYLDLYLIHWPMPALNRFVDSWRGLIHLQTEGRVRAIGVSNFKPAHTERLIGETGVAPALNQIELNPRTNRAECRAYHQQKHIVTESWGPLGRGNDLLDEPLFATLAAKYGKTAGQIVLRWHVELGLAVSAKSANPDRLASNLDVYDFHLTDDDIDAITALDTGAHPAVDSDTWE